MTTRLAVTDIRIVVPGADRVRSLLARVRAVAREGANRRALALLDARMLLDIGAGQRDAGRRHPGVWFFVPPPA